MNKIFKVLCILFVCAGPLCAQSEMLPSEVYYNENIAVNIIGSESPMLAGGGDDSFDPNKGNGWNPELGAVDSPVGDYVGALAAFVIFYGGYLLFFRKEKSVQ